MANSTALGQEVRRLETREERGWGKGGEEGGGGGGGGGMQVVCLLVA